MKLSARKRPLAFTTESTIHQRGKDRRIVIEAFPLLATVRLEGTQTRYSLAWSTVFELAAEIHVRREKEARRASRTAARGLR